MANGRYIIDERRIMNGSWGQVWLEDERSIETKLTVMKNLGLGGVAAWQLGLEDKDICGF